MSGRDQQPPTTGATAAGAASTGTGAAGTATSVTGASTASRVTPSAEDTAAAYATAASAGTLAAAASTAPIRGGLGDYARTYVRRARGGEAGSLPAVLALVVLVAIFSIAHHPFFTLGNLANLVTQSAPIMLLAMGLVFVLLLGEIDLSAGVASGVSAATAAVIIYKGQSTVVAVLAAIATGLLTGYLIGVTRSKLRVPSFIVTLALFLALQGVVLLIVTGATNQGNIPLNSPALNALENSPMPNWAGWLLLAVTVGGYAAYKLADTIGRRRLRLTAEPTALTAIKVAAVLVVGGVLVYLLNVNRALNQGAGGFATVNGKIVRVQAAALTGVPWIVPILLAFFAVLAFVLKRTPYGRHVYAVGGNTEAARRAGIKVDAIRISVFVICSTMAAVSGIVLASQIGVNSAEGGGNTLLLAVGAVVVGGTSLFGGKGRVLDAVIGAVVVTVIQNGMSDIVSGNNGSAVQFIVTGLVLALAATVDAVSRRRAGAAGL